METQQILQPNKPKLSVGFFFLCLGTLITLITSVVSFLNLIFSTLDKQFPDALNSTYQYGYSTYDFESIRVALATLIIFFPIFIIVSHFWRKFMKGEMEHYDDVVRKWVIYIILFISAIVVAIDLVTLVRYFVSGEITNRFIYKVVTTLVVVTIVGIYYILLLRKKLDAKPKLGWIFAGAGIVIALASVIYSFSIMGSPAKQRIWRLDDRRVSDLQSIQYQVINYWQQKEKLPATLKDLQNPMSGYSIPVDPEFEKGTTYEYIPGDKLTFELCATFGADMPKGWQEYSNGGGIIAPMVATNVARTDTAIAYPPYPGGGVNESWNHKAGRTCYTRTIDKDIYPPFPKPVK